MNSVADQIENKEILIKVNSTKTLTVMQAYCTNTSSPIIGQPCIIKTMPTQIAGILTIAWTLMKPVPLNSQHYMIN